MCPWHLLLTMIALSGLVGCGSSVRTSVAREEPAEECDPANGGAASSANCGAIGGKAKDPEFEVTSRSPLVVGSGTTVTLEGRGFRPTMQLAVPGLEESSAPRIQVESDSKASFVMAESNAFGHVDLALTQDGAQQIVSVFLDGGKTDHPIMTVSASEVCASVKFYDAAGVLREGTKACSSSSALADCSADGQTDCRAVADFPAVDKDAKLVATNLLAGVTIAGVAGTVVPKPADCATDGETGCVTVAAFKAAKMANFTAVDIRDAVVIAGVTGTLSGAPASCSADGETGCLATASYTAAATAGLAGKVLNSTTVAGVAGNVTLPSAANVLVATQYGVGGTGTTGTLTLPSAGNVRASAGVYGVGGSGTTPTLADCSADGGTSCVVDNGTNYKAAASSVLLAANIKRGVQIGGVTGNFPSATSPLPRYSDSGATTNTTGSDQTDLTSFSTQVKTDGTFEFWDSTGTRLTGAGDSDIVNTNVISGIQFENLSITGTAAAACTDAGQTGCLTTSFYRSTKPFRNTARSATATVAFDNTTTPASTGLDIYDSIDDYHNNNSGLPPDQPWGATYAAGSSYWTAGGTDVTTSGLCNHLDDQCVYTDKVTGLIWSEMSENLDFSGIAAGDWPCGGASCTQSNGNVSSGGGSGTYTAGANMRWWDAIYACNHLNSANFGGYSTGWRLPTQKELMQANVHGIRSVASSSFISGTATTNRWSASTLSNGTANAWYVSPVSGTAGTGTKSGTNAFVCVR